MSVNLKPGTSSQAELSKISETTKREDKGQNRSVIRWFDVADPNRPFLITSGRVWTYGETAAEITARVEATAKQVRPTLDPDSVFEVLAGVFGGGLTVGEGPVTDLEGSALVVPTSGTTGSPKLVRLTMANLEAAVSASAEHLSNGPDDTWLLAMPLNHVAGLSILLRQAWTGGSVFMIPGFDEALVWDAIDREVTMVSVVPTMLHRLLEDGGPGSPGRLRTVLVGGGPIPTGLLERAEDRGLPVRPTYGLTETFGQVATLRPGAPLAYKAHPLPGVELRIEPDGLVGVRSAQVSPGYLGEPDRTGGWLVTNDLGELDDESAVKIIGRADTIIVTGGENVSPERVEAELHENPDVDEAVVVGVPDPEWGEKIGCVYSGPSDPDSLAGWLRERVPGFMVPKLWLRVPSVPRTSLGKPDRAGALSVLSRETS